MAALSLATDLGNGYQLEKALRDSILAVGLARELGIGGQDLSDVYYLALLEHIGCTAGSHELAANFGGDDNTVRRTALMVDAGRPREVFAAFGPIYRHHKPIDRAAILVRSMTSGRKLREAQTIAVCEAADRLAVRLDMSDGVRRGLAHTYTRWDGKGIPPLQGEEIAIAARIVRLSHLVEVFNQLGGREAAVQMVSRRTEGDFDPSVASAFLRNAGALLVQIEPPSVWEIALATEPEPRPWLPASRLDQVAQAFADFTDLKSTFTLGHSSAVARLAEAAARVLGMNESDAVAIRRAGRFHDIGRVSVPNGVWEKAGPLTASDWERVRLHPYYSERVLSHSSLLEPIAKLAGMHHERLDGSGYHRGAEAGSISKAARVLVAADVYQAMSEDRPHRPALKPSSAADELKAEVASGRLDREAVTAVLEAAGVKRTRVMGSWPARLTDREVEVLRLVARGGSDKDIARALFISRNTVHHHIKQVYDKIEVSSRAGAALFAMEHDLISN